MKLAAKGAEAVASYWAEFKDASSYKIVFVGNSASSAPALLTRDGEKPVGYVLRNKTSPGALVLLPDVDFDPPEFVQTKGQ